MFGWTDQPLYFLRQTFLSGVLLICWEASHEMDVLFRALIFSIFGLKALKKDVNIKAGMNYCLLLFLLPLILLLWPLLLQLFYKYSFTIKSTITINTEERKYSDLQIWSIQIFYLSKTPHCKNTLSQLVSSTRKCYLSKSI